jgi:methionyl aminopeptidase
VITIKSSRELDTMGKAGRIVAETLALVRTRAVPGASTLDLDRAAEEFIRSHPGATPSFKGLYGFPATLCTSINAEVVHGIPSKKRVLQDGDIVSVDVGVCIGGLHADSAITAPVGEIAPATRALLETTQRALAAGIAAVKAGGQVGDIGHAVQREAESMGYGVVRELVGHGIGTQFHEEPQIPNFGRPQTGPRLLPGMTIAIEPMINMGKPGVRTLADRWTVVTQDGSLSAHFEHTVAVTENGARVLTMAPVAAGVG